MTPALVQQLEKAELSVAYAPWPDTPYRTVRRLNNHEAAEKAAEVAETFYKPKMAILTQIEALVAQGDPDKLVGGLWEIFGMLHEPEAHPLIP